MMLKVNMFCRLLYTFFVLVISCTSCEKVLGLKEPAVTPLAVFDDCWQTIDRNYALFPVKNINWDSVYLKMKVQVSADITNANLFKLLSNTLDPLKDGHVTLVAPGSAYTYEGFYKGFPANFNLENIKKTYLNNQYRQKGPVLYKVVDNTGYLYYASFREDITDNDLNDIMAELSATKGLIIDVRNNNGGNLSNADKLFSRFINAPKLVKYEVKKKGPGHNDYYEKEAVYASPAGTYYNKAIVVVTNRGCFSACNDFVMYMSYLPNVRIVGDQTGGGGALPADYLLVNGWKLRYSSSLTLSPDKTTIENGILPDITAGITPIDEINGRDPILEKAYQLLQ